VLALWEPVLLLVTVCMFYCWIQLDVEMSFVTQDDVMNLIESLLKHCWPKHLEPLTLPLPRLSYSEAIQRYGTDKPDTRYSNLVIDFVMSVSLCTEHWLWCAIKNIHKMNHYIRITFEFFLVKFPWIFKNLTLISIITRIWAGNKCCVFALLTDHVYCKEMKYLLQVKEFFYVQNVFDTWIFLTFFIIYWSLLMLVAANSINTFCQCE